MKWRPSKEIWTKKSPKRVTLSDFHVKMLLILSNILSLDNKEVSFWVNWLEFTVKYFALLTALLCLYSPLSFLQQLRWHREQPRRAERFACSEDNFAIIISVDRKWKLEMLNPLSRSISVSRMPLFSLSSLLSPFLISLSAARICWIPFSCFNNIFGSLRRNVMS